MLLRYCAFRWEYSFSGRVDHIILNPEGKIAYLDLIEDIPIGISLGRGSVFLLEEKRSYLKLQENLPKSLWNNFQLSANGKIKNFNDYAIYYNFKDCLSKIDATPVASSFKGKIDRVGNTKIEYNS